MRATSSPPSRPRWRSRFARRRHLLAARPRRGRSKLRKYLPRSYRQSFAFVKPRTSLAVVDDSYHCLMRCPPTPQPPQPPMVIGWGEALAFAMRQPRLAEALGLDRPLDVPLDAAPRLEHGGWLWVELAPPATTSRRPPPPGFQRCVRHARAELPRPAGGRCSRPWSFRSRQCRRAAAHRQLRQGVRRGASLRRRLLQARARAPAADSADARRRRPSAHRSPATKACSWPGDDEDILEGQNRALGRAADGEDPVLAPRGVFGYRVDVREAGRRGVDVAVEGGGAVERRRRPRDRARGDAGRKWCPANTATQLWLPAWFAELARRLAGGLDQRRDSV
jgi:hypothetical protein